MKDSDPASNKTPKLNYFGFGPTCVGCLLKAGQSFYFTADREHRLVNNGRSVVEVLWITSPPYF